MKKNLLIIGGTSGISIETAKIFAKNNFNIIICSRNLEKLEVIAREIEEEYKCNCDFFFFDINNELSHLELLNNIKVFPDVILFSIGMMSNQPKDDLNIENTKMIVNTNYFSPIIFLETACDYFYKKNKSISFIVLSSVAGEKGRKKNYIYGSAKAGLSNYVSGLRQKYANTNVRLLTIVLGFVHTERTKDMKMMSFLRGKSSDVAKKIYYSYIRKKHLIFLPKKWRLIIIIIKLIPEKFFIKMNF